MRKPPAYATPVAATSETPVAQARFSEFLILVAPCIEPSPPERHFMDAPNQYPATLGAGMRAAQPNLGQLSREVVGNAPCVPLRQQKTGPPKRTGSCQAQVRVPRSKLGAPPGVLHRHWSRSRAQAAKVRFSMQVLMPRMRMRVGCECTHATRVAMERRTARQRSCRGPRSSKR